MTGTLLFAGGTLSAGDFDAGAEAAAEGDFATAIKKWRPVAEAGNSVAQHNLGVIYRNGLGVPINYEEAAKWSLRAAENGHAAAQNNLGVMYSYGHGVPANDAEAARWYERAARQGHAAGQYNLGKSLEEGKGVPRDLLAAHMWFRLAEVNGSTRARRARIALEEELTAKEIATADDLSRDCRASDYKECNLNKPRQE
ncbi:tetratricopeptide repeat protein [Maritimibacter sp. 55A14]|uniref:tetratricopeptide repeat protein n=1 Tax=Maritimibacter sp. 55A14 TaxID=2174844 RepID=UPI0018EE7C78|nr:tetratricopeptide repeat protein [Maritimibacter sp. 55A14]